MGKERNQKKENRLGTAPVNENFGSFGLEPPKIYRAQQGDGTQKRRKDNKKNNPNAEEQNLTRDEIRQKQNQKRKKKNKFRKFLLWLFLILLLVSVGVVLSLTVFFNITAIQITGNERYEQQEILAACTIETGDNLFLIDIDTAEEKIEILLPYIYRAEISRKLPASIQISVTEASPAYSIKNEDKSYLLLDDQFKVLETSAQSSGKTIRISKAEVATANVGYPIEFDDEEIGNHLKQLAEAVKAYSVTEATSVYSKGKNDNYIVYNGRIKFKLGSCENLEKKIYQGLAVCEELNQSNPKAKGVLNLTDDKSIYFTEE